MLFSLICKLSKKLGESSFFGNILSLMSAAILSHIISIIASWVTAKLYTPAEMGIFSNYSSLLSIIGVIVCFQYEQAIVLPEDDREARQVFGICTLFCLGSAILCGFVCFPFGSHIAMRMNAPELGPWLRLMPLSVLLSGIYSSLQFWHSRRKTLGSVALSNTTQTAVTSGSQILAGLEPVHLHGGMIVGSFLGRLISVVLLTIKTLRQETTFLLSGVTLHGIRQMAIRYCRFLTAIPGSFCDQFCSALPSLGLTYFFGAAETGYYGLSHRLLGLPLSIINNSVSRAFYPEAKAAHTAGTLKPLCLHTTNLLLRTGCTPFFLLSLVGPALISFVFGAEWYTAGEYIKWLSIWLLLGFVYSPLSCIFSVMEQPQKYTVLNAINLAVRAVALLAGGAIGDPTMAIALCGISGALVSIFNCAYVLRLVQINLGEILACFLRQFFHAIPYTVPTIVSLALIGQNMISTVIAICSGCVFLLLEMKPILHALQTIGKDSVD